MCHVCICLSLFFFGLQHGQQESRVKNSINLSISLLVSPVYFQLDQFYIRFTCWHALDGFQKIDFQANLSLARSLLTLLSLKSITPLTYYIFQKLKIYPSQDCKFFFSQALFLTSISSVLNNSDKFSFLCNFSSHSLNFTLPNLVLAITAAHNHHRHLICPQITKSIYFLHLVTQLLNWFHFSLNFCSCILYKQSLLPCCGL